MIYPRRSLILGFLMLLSGFATSQTFLGISGGGGIDDMVSLRASVPLQVKLSKTLRLRTGLVLTQQHNADILRKLDRLRDYRRTTISYIGVPLQIQVSLPIQSFSVYAVAGPQVNYGVSFSTSFLEDGNYGNQRLDFDDLQIKRFDLGLNAGLGVSANIRNDRILFIEMLLLLSSVRL